MNNSTKIIIGLVAVVMIYTEFFGVSVKGQVRVRVIEPGDIVVVDGSVPATTILTPEQVKLSCDACHDM